MKRFTNIALIVDTDRDNSAALKRAISLASNNQASLSICGIVDALHPEAELPIAGLTPTELSDIAIGDERDRLERIVSDTATDDVSIDVKVLKGKPSIEIIRLVIRDGYDLVIKGAEGSSGVRDMLFGSTDMHLMRKCPCPVWIVKSTEAQKYRSILAAVDLDPEDATKNVLNRQILEMSTSLALAEFSQLHVVHAWQLMAERYCRSPRTGLTNAEVDEMVAQEANNRRRWLENLVSTYGAGADKNALEYVKPELHVIKGDARYVVSKTAGDLDVDLIVMGTVGRTGIPGFIMGNTAESILNQIDCSVLAIKPPGFVSPVTG